MNLATKVETPLTHIMDTPIWSPDGSRIAFAANVQQTTHNENAGSSFWLTAN